MKNKIIFFLSIVIFIFLGLPGSSYAINNPTLVRILNYYADSDGRITFKWQQDYAGCIASGFDCSGGIQLSTNQFPSNGGEGFYNTDLVMGDNKGFMNFTTACNELTTTGRICVSHPRILKNRWNGDTIAANSSGLLYSDVSSYVNSGGQMHTILGGIFRPANDNNYRESKTNHFSFGDVELSYVPPVVVKTPILIVPGLLGTELFNQSEKLWLDLIRNFIDINDQFMDSLGLKSNLTSDINLNIGNIISKETVNIGLGQVLIFDYNFGLKNQGYVENETLFTFPYDWRYGTSGEYADGKTNADLLAEKIHDIMVQTGADKVDVVAHSLGGLVVKKYVAEHQTNHYINKTIFVGVPNIGAPKAVKVLLQGDNFGIPWLAQDEMKKISENLPAAYDLLPSQKYYNVKGSFVTVIDRGTLGQSNYTQKDLNYSEFENFITGDHALNSLALTNAQNVHTVTFDNFDMRSAGVDVYAINGCKAGTVGKVVENRFKNVFGQSFTEYKNPKFASGDGTVPLESATNLPIDQNHKFYSLVGEHSKMMSQDGSRQEIVNLLAGSSLSVDSKLITQDISKCNLNGKAISVFSPINILVTDQDGNKLGLTDDGSIFNEIPNANFEIWGEPFGSTQDMHKFLYLPTDEGEMYDIKIKGTGIGTYTINSQNISNGEVTGTEIFSNLPVTPALTGTINLGTQVTLTVQQTSGASVQTITPSAVLTGSQAEDVIPPASSIMLDGKVFKAGRFAGEFKKDVVVTIKAADTITSGHENTTSGVLDIEYNLDNMGFKKVVGENARFTVSGKGDHIITFFATDKAGNNEPVQELRFTIKNPAVKK